MEAIKRQCKRDWPEIKELAFLGAPGAPVLGVPGFLLGRKALPVPK